ncbi:hypothetical protein FOA43_003092 [Brettanomyces nanus]|uniref:Uncharacterized protein n=1 Tax=Eeniella nana TaxID=13502 RepID=A0A875S6X5_EENNA|nr:uncharacterized protein FOA43_003092 [Brettanomyces nanus]QPG75732.1 hypothetical protein FOA43_003092 [Brettanomyces nanus]
MKSESTTDSRFPTWITPKVQKVVEGQEDSLFNPLNIPESIQEDKGISPSSSPRTAGSGNTVTTATTGATGATGATAATGATRATTASMLAKNLIKALHEQQLSVEISDYDSEMIRILQEENFSDTDSMMYYSSPCQRSKHLESDNEIESRFDSWLKVTENNLQQYQSLTKQASLSRLKLVERVQKMLQRLGQSKVGTQQQQLLMLQWCQNLLKEANYM